MSNLKNEILSTLRENEPIEGIFDKLSKYQKILIKNHSNPVFKNEDKVKLLKIYNQLQKIGENLYRYNALKTNNFNTQDEQEDLENVVLKGGISNVRYVWHSEHGEHTCDDCLELDGHEFDIFDEVPERPHPNCQCTIEVVKEEDEDDNQHQEQNTKPSKIDTPKSNPKTSKCIMPCNGTITSPYGTRVHPVYKTTKMHNGWDIGVPIGTPIKSIANGTVHYAGPANGYGKMVVITHKIDGEVITSEYGHISSWNVHSGQQIKQGDVIAKSGNEGTSSGPHLHLTIRKGPYRGTAVDPNEYIKY